MSKQTLTSLALGLVIFSLQARGEVRETATMSEALANVDSETLLVLDIDNTLIEAAQSMGTDQWYYHLLKRLREQEMLPETAALHRADEIWNAVQSRISVRPVETDTPKLLRELQAKGVKTLILTARTSAIADVTLEQLASTNIDPTASAVVGPTAQLGLADSIEPEAHFEHGILFVGESSDKGTALAKFLRQTGSAPKRIVFVDDKPKHTQNVDHAMHQLDIPCIAYRYGAADERVKNFNGQLADLQYHFLDAVLSDEAAMAIARGVSPSQLTRLIRPLARREAIAP